MSKLAKRINIAEV